MKLSIIFLLSLISTIQANKDLFSNNTLQNPDDISGVADGVFEEMANMLVYDDAFTCYKYNIALLWNARDSLIYALEDDWWLATEQVGLIVHKLPVVWGECVRIVADIEHLENDFYYLDSIGSTQLFIHIFENLMFNLGDIIKNVQLAPERIEAGDYQGYGRNIGEIIADVVYINPSDEEIWTVANSEVVEKNSADKVPSTFYSNERVPLVQASQFDPLSKIYERAINYKGKSLKIQTKTVQNLILNNKTKLKKGEQDRPIWDRIADIEAPKKRKYKS